MPRPLTDRQKQALIVFLDYERQLTTPTLLELATELGIKKRPALSFADALVKKGMLWQDAELTKRNRFLTPQGREAAIEYEREIEL